MTVYPVVCTVINEKLSTLHFQLLKVNVLNSSSPCVNSLLYHHVLTVYITMEDLKQ